MCKEEVKFSLLSRDEHRRGVTDNPCGTVQTSPSCSEQAAMSTQPEAVPCRDGRSRARGSVALFSWCPGRGFSSRSHGWVRGRQCLVGWARGSAAAWDVCAAAQTPLLHRQASPFLPTVRLALLCFTPLISTNFVLKFIWPHKRVHIFGSPCCLQAPRWAPVLQHLQHQALRGHWQCVWLAACCCWAVLSQRAAKTSGFFVSQVGLQWVLHRAPGAHVCRAQPEGSSPASPPGRTCPVKPCCCPFQPPPLLHQQRTGHSLTSN